MVFPVNDDVNYPNIELQSNPCYKTVLLHLPVAGLNNSTSFTDVLPGLKIITRCSDAKIGFVQKKRKEGNGYFVRTNDYLTCSRAIPISGDFCANSGRY